ncbi:hypothetical protein GCM10010989_05870 [Croceicoccus pelagius]|uniref:Uncharacterized protein n=1 Tax=Croceicoccus pelagius TaxID=1703341 RepID=A0A916Y911_9SPHN|nr:hypothetical protein GCM10010989_05870 [Croceicoccus pelagius]
MSKEVALSQSMGKIHAQRDFDPFDGIEEKQAKLLVKEIEIDGVAKLGTGLKLIGANGARGIVGIRDALLQRLPIGRQATVADALKMADGFGLVGDAQTAALEKGELVGEAEMGFGIRRKHRPRYEEGRPLMP